MIADGKGEHMSRVFANPLTELAEYEEMNQDLNRGNGPVQISGCMDSQKVHLMEEAGERLRWKLVVTYDDSRAKRSMRILNAFETAYTCTLPGIFCSTPRTFTAIC